MKKLQGRVLILNSSYEPIGTMGVKKAMCKISRADSSLQVIEWSDDAITSSKGEYPVPSVLRLIYYINIIKRRNESGAKREKIYHRDKFRCSYCSIKMGGVHPQLRRKLSKEDLTLDHIFPLSRGGQTRPDNLVTCCKPCNQRKANRTPEEAFMPLLISQTMLSTHLDTIAISAYANLYCENWKKYIYTTNHSNSDPRYSHSDT